MLAVAQLVEHLTVIQAVVGSKPIGQPEKPNAGRIGYVTSPSYSSAREADNVCAAPAAQSVCVTKQLVRRAALCGPAPMGYLSLK